MANIPAASRGAFMRTIVRTSVPASRSTLRFYTRTVSNNDPELLERERQRNLSKEQPETSTPVSGAPGWNEALATSSEAAVKADHNGGNPMELQERTVAFIKRQQHHDSDGSQAPYEPEVTTEWMMNGEASTQASYQRDEIDGPLKTAHGTVVEEVEYTEDVRRRKAAT
ncbi:hypothetical protein GSI_02024 [Ganoderma sinense ZZ0214-1]|uniref:Uncharacterized protein n=1 Tax=Ganoderma sinense ZZ0214-1 TaxID=1077348 RepID=A0A2G8SNH9_9APHY|nr:hypothetical protein GSI_02024 [Ganoderma sinense ZZ0214-1]